MKKAILFFFIVFFCGSYCCHSQDLGYNTKDAGVDYLWVKDSPGINVHFAFNAKIHHSIVTSLGYKEAWRPIPNTHNNEKGKGFGGSLGYRYYFKYIPKGVFLGARTHIWSMSMYKTANTNTANVNLVVGQPSAEIGYTAVINDLAFISFYYSAGKQFQLSAADNSYGYGKGTVSAFGISGGVRF